MQLLCVVFLTIKNRSIFHLLMPLLSAHARGQSQCYDNILNFCSILIIYYYPLELFLGQPTPVPTSVVSNLIYNITI